MTEERCQSCQYGENEGYGGMCDYCEQHDQWAPKEPEAVDHPAHYNRAGSMECIEEMVQVFGYKQTMDFCLLNVWKYRYRAADKGGVEDMKKSDWYMRMYVELDKRMRRGDMYGDAE